MSTLTSSAISDTAGAEERRPRRWLAVASAASAVAVCLIIYLLRLDQVVGMGWDDAWYVVLAKALANGQGYTLINAPVPGIVPSLYPPAFPWLLSLAYRIGPEFPRNIWLLKSVSIAALLGAGGVTYHYFRRERALSASMAFGIALATTLSPALIFLATSTVMSECVFTFAQLLTIAVVQRGARPGQGNRSWWYLAAGGALAGFTFLTRTISIALLVGIELYLLTKRRWRGALVFTLTVALVAGPWLLYARLHPPPSEDGYQGTLVQSYMNFFWLRSGNQRSAGTISATELPGRLWHNTLDLLGNRMAIVLLPTAGDLFKQGNEMQPRQTDALSLALGALTVAGFIVAARERLTLAEFVVPLSIGAIASWPYDPNRLLVPLTPFLIFYLLMSCRVGSGTGPRQGRPGATRARQAVAGALVGSLLLLSVYENISYITREHSSRPAAHSDWSRRFMEHQQMYDWIRSNLPPDSVIAAQNPAQVYLYTGRKTIASDRAQENWEKWRQHLNVRYLARTSFYPIPQLEWGDIYFDIVYHARGELYLRVLDLGPVASGAPPGD